MSRRRPNNRPKADAVKLGVSIGRLGLKNPVLAASGTFGYGAEMRRFFDPGILGGIVGKTVTPQPREGNLPTRIWETPAGMLNAIGLQNPGMAVFLERILPDMARIPTRVFVSIAAETAGGFARLCRKLDERKEVDAIELNLSCPNVARGMDFAMKPVQTGRVVSACRKATSKILIPKLSPNVTDIAAIARAAEDGGADALALINTLLAMAVDWRRGTARIARVLGGLSGPAIRPVALRMVWQVRQAVHVPVIGVGGISSADDVLEMMAVGASAVQVGTANFVDPEACRRIIEALPMLLASEGIRDIRKVIGSFEDTGERLR